MAGMLVGRNEAEVRDRTAALMTAVGSAGDADAWLDERRERCSSARPTGAQRVREFEEAGAQRVMLQDFIPWDLDHVKP